MAMKSKFIPRPDQRIWRGLTTVAAMVGQLDAALKPTNSLFVHRMLLAVLRQSFGLG